jgi:tetratricopeptide (TPR) repeat protein
VSVPRADRRRVGMLLTVLVVAAGGLVLHAVEPSTTPASIALPHGDEVRRRFDEAVVMLHAKRYDHAVTALHRVLVLAPGVAEAHVNMGFALLGLQRTKEARDFFEGAMELQPGLANAYYGLALAHEAAGDLELATGAMRSYLHLARDERPEHLRRARAALWEWENAAPKR